MKDGQLQEETTVYVWKRKKLSQGHQPEDTCADHCWIETWKASLSLMLGRNWSFA
uniref:Uncharacterized protein n=1 Tax=Arundo donax TaxID=35708 RepID=A0A0A9E136_ARUDO